jgi:ferredoxin
VVVAAGGETTVSQDTGGLSMKVWVDQDVCTGDGLCEEHCPSIFTMRDGLSFVQAPQGAPTLRGGAGDLVDVPDHLLDAVLNAAEDCPGECIFIEG